MDWATNVKNFFILVMTAEALDCERAKEYEGEDDTWEAGSRRRAA